MCEWFVVDARAWTATLNNEKQLFSKNKWITGQLCSAERLVLVGCRKLLFKLLTMRTRVQRTMILNKIKQIIMFMRLKCCVLYRVVLWHKFQFYFEIVILILISGSHASCDVITNWIIFLLPLENTEEHIASCYQYFRALAGLSFVFLDCNAMKAFRKRNKKTIKYSIEIYFICEHLLQCHFVDCLFLLRYIYQFSFNWMQTCAQKALSIQLENHTRTASKLIQKYSICSN